MSDPDDYDDRPTIARFPCTLCGSRNWPTKETSCPLCYDDSEDDEPEQPTP
jgi:hypothetical protein